MAVGRYLRLIEKRRECKLEISICSDRLWKLLNGFRLSSEINVMSKCRPVACNRRHVDLASIGTLLKVGNETLDKLNVPDTMGSPVPPKKPIRGDSSLKPR